MTLSLEFGSGFIFELMRFLQNWIYLSLQEIEGFARFFYFAHQASFRFVPKIGVNFMEEQSIKDLVKRK